MKNIKTFVQVSLLTVGLLLSIKSSYSQSISDHFFGENAWMPDTIGNSGACQAPPCVLNGKLHKQWDNIKNSGCSIIRFGGIAPDRNMPTNYQYIKMIDSIRAKGMEPIIQVPFHNNRYTAQQAADIVKYINITKDRKIKYWIIANEPDLSYSYTTSAQIANYFRAFASAMKAIDPTILIIGPECAWFNKGIITGLTTPNGPDDITGKDAAGRYYLDVISFHTYPFNGTQTRADVVSKLTAAGSLNDNLIYLNSRVAASNNTHNRTGSAAIKTAITEANINWQNSTTDNLNGVGANSFIGGQFVAEMMGIGMKNSLDFINIWSVVEGNSITNNIGFIDGSTNKKKPLYHHFKLLADNFKGNYVHGTTNQVNVKSFGSKNSEQTCVLILNEDQTKNYNFTVKLNTLSIAASNELNININAGSPKEYTGVIENQSTTLLKFDATGNLIEKIEYKLSGNADVNLAPTATVLASALLATIIPAGTTSFCPGGSVTFNANVGTGYTYQWKKNNIAIAGATSPSYIGNAAGNYSVDITSAGITTSSASETITVLPAPIAAITPQAATSFIEGGSLALNATTGAGYLYQWKRDNISIDGATSASFIADQAGDYQIRTTLGSCKNWSAPLLISVYPKATITVTEPTNFCSGGSVKLKANVIKGYTYQWKKDDVDIDGATDSTYIAIESGSYIVVATIAGLTTISEAQVVTVTPMPTATITPLGATTVCSGSVNLQANTGLGLIYQWKKDNNAIVGATNSLYSASTSGSYQIRVTQGSCITWSAPINVNVQSFKNPTITPDGPLTFCSGGKVILYANTCSDYLYQWKKNGANIKGATSSVYTAITSGSYQVKITSGTSVGWSAPLTVTVNNCKPSGSIASREYTPDSTTVSSLPNEESNEYFEINVFPNPSNGRFTIQLNKENSGQNNIGIQLLNSTGQVVYRNSFSFFNGKEEIDVRENMVPGLYILLVINGNDIITKRIIIK